MRKVSILILIMVVLLAACAETPAPTATWAPTAPATAPVATDIPLPPDTPGAAAGAEPTPLPSTPSPTPPASTDPLPTTDASPWPRFLRELDFGIAAGNSYGPRALAVHPGLGRLYARTHTQGLEAQGQVTMLDLASGQVLATVETGPDSYSEGNLLVDPVRDRVYALNPGDTTSSVLDAETLEVTTLLDGVAQVALDAEGGRLYAAGRGSLYVLDAETYDTLRQTSLDYANAPDFLALVAVPARGRIHVAYRDGEGYGLGYHDAGTLEPLATARLPGRPDDLVPDPARERVYVTLDDGEQSLLWTFDGSGQRVGEWVLGEWTQNTSLALDATGDRLFLARDVYNDYSLTILDLASGQQVGDVALDQAPNALTWSPETGQVLVSHTYAHEITVVDVAAGEVSDRFPTALNLAAVAVDPQRGYLLVTDSAGRLHVLDSETDEELALLPGGGHIAVDSRNGRIYTGGQGAGRVRIFDADTLEQTGQIRTDARPVADAYHGELLLAGGGIFITSLETMTITGVISDTLPQNPGFSPNPAAVDARVDPGSGRIFAFINNGVPGSNNGNYLYVYEPQTYRRVFTDTERSPIHLDVDPTTGRAYVSRTHLAGRSTSLYSPEQGGHYVARLDAAFGALRVDPALGYVYLSLGTSDRESGHLIILDAANLDVLGSVPIPGGYTLRALDPQRNLLYLGTHGGQVQVWSATGGERPGAAEPTAADLPVEDVRHFSLSPGGDILFAGSLYRSEDGGASWQYLGARLPRRGVQEIVVSPDYAQDETIFAMLMATDEGLGIWKTADGGRTWRMANQGLSDLAVSDLALSPAFSQDGTLFALTRKQGLFRSTDRGQSWQRLIERYLDPASYRSPGSLVAISPTFDRDGTVLVSHEGLHLSADSGQTWNTVFAESAESLALSPEFAADRTLFAWFSNAGLLRSTDAGETWEAASTGLTTTDFGTARIILSADFGTSRLVYLLWTPTAPEAPVQVFRSPDAGTSWEKLAGPPPTGIAPLKLSPDGHAFVTLDEAGRLVRWPLADLSWDQPAAPSIDQITVNFLAFSPGFGSTSPTAGAPDQRMLATSEGAGILLSDDGGLTWSNTNFPLRVAFGDALQPLFVTSETVLAGTRLGLYRFDAEGWHPVSGGLPQRVEVRGPEVGADGSLRVLVGGETEDDPQRVFLSTDLGQTWSQPIPALPYMVLFEDLRFSSAFGTDHTAFLAPAWQTPLRSVAGGAWEEIDLPGDGTLSVLEISPAFGSTQPNADGRESLLLARLQDNSLWRSTDGSTELAKVPGETWTDVSGPWGDEAPMGVQIGAGYVLHAVTFSPAFETDGVLLTRAGNTLYRSTDGGATWTEKVDLGAGFAQAVFSPEYGRDGELYLLAGSTLHRSTDRGASWQALPPAPWGAFDEIRLRLSPAFARDRKMVAWTLSGAVYQSFDGGQSWQDAREGLPGVSIREIRFSPAYAEDGLLYLVPNAEGLYKRAGAAPWQPITAQAPPPQPTSSPTAPSPTATPSPAACATLPDRFLSVWEQTGDRLGCPQRPAEALDLAEQPFEAGRMIWNSKTRQIYVLWAEGTWQAFDDTWTPDRPASDPALVPPEGLVQPVRGFGKVWREELGGPQAAIGWALEEERPVDGWWQRFDGGLLVWTDRVLGGSAGTAYLLYDDGTWQALAAP